MVSHCLPSPEHLDANIPAALGGSLPGNAWLGNRAPRALVHCSGRLRRLPGWLSRAPRSSFGCDGQLCLTPLGVSDLPLAATSSRVRRLPPRRRRQRVQCEGDARKQPALHCDEGDLSEMGTEVPSPWHTPHTRWLVHAGQHHKARCRPSLLCPSCDGASPDIAPRLRRGWVYVAIASRPCVPRPLLTCSARQRPHSTSRLCSIDESVNDAIGCPM
jgi:hypothetical protein